MVPSLSSLPLDLHLLLFVSFFGVTAFAIRFSNRPGVRKTFLAFFLVLVIVQGTVVPPGWPFNGWTLFGQEAPTEDIRYEFRVVDGNGNELQYDPRATSVLISPVSHRYGKKIDDQYWGESYNEREASNLGQYLLMRAKTYRSNVEAGTYDEAYKFPRHQLDYRWNDRRLNHIESFQEIRLYRITIHVSDDGNEAETTETMAWRYAGVNEPAGVVDT